MKREATHWDIATLRRDFHKIHFPEYQREPNIWTTGAKQRLVDSIMRGFDIASFYFFRNQDASIECIDGRQRINAILSFLGENPDDEDNGFAFRISNEIYDEGPHPLGSLNGRSLSQIKSAAKRDKIARGAAEDFLKYRFTVVLFDEPDRPEEFNLQFTRLNLGAIINAGEKLHAMVGDMRDLCFKSPKVGKHPFLSKIGIPERRYARQQVAAALVAQVFSKLAQGEFTRTRHFDLQKFLKENVRVDPARQPWISELKLALDRLRAEMPDAKELLRNRAITVSAVLMAWELLHEDRKSDIRAYVVFLREFLCRLKWQVTLDGFDTEYAYLGEFQRHLTQASAEKGAVDARREILQSQLQRWRTAKALDGDREYVAKHKRKPADICRQIE